MNTKSALLALFTALPLLANASNFRTVQESGGTFPAGASGLSGKTLHDNVVPGSLQVVVGNCVWNDDGKGGLAFGMPADTVSDEELGRLTTHGSGDCNFKLAKANILPGSVQISINGSVCFRDDCSSNLTPLGISASGSVNYDSGNIVLHFNSMPSSSDVVTASYTYHPFAGSGSICYASGAWSLGLNQTLPANGTVVLRYSYDEDHVDPANGREFVTVEESAGTIRMTGSLVMSGLAGHDNIVPGSMQISAGDFVWTDSGDGSLSLSSSGSGTVLYASGAWTIRNDSGAASSDTLPLTIRYSYYLAPSYSVKFAANGGTGTMAAQKMTVGKAATLRKNAFKRSGCLFLGWAKTKTGAVAYKNGAAVKNLAAAGKSVTLYARWAKKIYRVKFCHTYKDETGKAAVQKFAYGKAKRLAKNKFKRKGYVFQGWAKSKALAKKGKVAFKNRKKVKNLVANGKTVKLYAVWRKR